MLQLQINMFLIRMQAKQVHRELSHLHRVRPWHHPRLRHIPGRCHSDPRHDPPARFTVSSFRYLILPSPPAKKCTQKALRRGHSGRFLRTNIFITVLQNLRFLLSAYTRRIADHGLRSRSRRTGYRTGRYGSSACPR